MDASLKAGLERVEEAVAALTDVVGPLEFDRQILVARTIRLDGFDNGNSSDVLDEYHGARGREVGWVVNDGREHEGSGWCDPDVGAAPATGNLDGCGKGESGRELRDEFGIPVDKFSLWFCGGLSSFYWRVERILGCGRGLMTIAKMKMKMKLKMNQVEGLTFPKENWCS